jgi:hypothetical protein
MMIRALDSIGLGFRISGLGSKLWRLFTDEFEVTAGVSVPLTEHDVGQ